MHALLPSNQIKIILISLLVLLAAASFVYNHFLIDKIMEQEAASVELWGKALEFHNSPAHDEISIKLNTSARLLSEFEEVPDSLIQMILEAESLIAEQDFVWEELIIEDRFSIPTILVDESDFIVGHRFIEEKNLSPHLVEKYSAISEPITITFGEGEEIYHQYIYYGESPTIQYLRFFPYVQFGILALLLGVGYITYRSITRSEQSNLWVGMAKEAAHQLGTPLSSIYGWLQLLKENNRENKQTLSVVHEIENDVNRLTGIAERFNKIGSQPELKRIDLEPMVDEMIAYMERRLPQMGKQIEVRKSIRLPANTKVDLNPQLFQWAIENVIKNAMDAIKKSAKKPFISISVSQKGEQILIDIEDSGSGMNKKVLREIFKPGYTTKKRGWGLGLSLTKRIIEEYHKGEIFVLHSETNKGTVIRVTLPV